MMTCLKLNYKKVFNSISYTTPVSVLLNASKVLEGENK